MTGRACAILGLMLLTGCGHYSANSGLQKPVVDMKGVDQVAYNRDTAECLDTRPFVMPNDYLVNCLKGKGYKMLAQY